MVFAWVVPPPTEMDIDERQPWYRGVPLSVHDRNHILVMNVSSVSVVQAVPCRPSDPALQQEGIALREYFLRSVPSGTHLLKIERVENRKISAQGA